MVHLRALVVGALVGLGCATPTAPRVDPPPADPPPAEAAPVADVDPLPSSPGAAGPLRQVALLKASNGRPGDNFGLSVTIAAGGGTLAVGALREDGSSAGVNADPEQRGAEDSGAVYVFRRSPDGWYEEAYVKPQHPDPGDGFGFSLALSADGATLAVGALREDGGVGGVDGDQTDGSAHDAGAVYVFFRTNEGWAQQAYLKADRPHPDDYFGWSLALSASGDRLAVGALQDDTAAPDAGAVYVFERDRNGWAPAGRITASNAGAGDRLSMSLAMTPDGRTLAVGAGGEASGSSTDPHDDGQPGAGAAYLFSLADAGWREIAFLKAFNARAGAQFGTSVALDADGRTVAVGAIGEATGPAEAPADQRFANAGAVYVYRSLGWPGREATWVKAEHIRDNTNFGRSVALDGRGELLAIGASWEHSDATGIDGDPTNRRAGFSGAAWLYRGAAEAWAPVHYIKPSNTAPQQNFGVNLAMSANGRVMVVGASGEASDPARGDGVGSDAPKSGAAYVFER